MIPTSGPAEIGALTALPAVARARRLLREIDAKTIADQVDLVQVPAPSLDEGARAAHFQERCRALGLGDTHLDEVGNVLVQLPVSAAVPSAPPVLLAAHLDTVFPRETVLTPRWEGDRIYVPGISDNARGLAALLALGRALCGAGLRTRHPVVLVATVGEEGRGDLRGVKHLFREGAPPVRAFISIDGADPARVVHQALGSRRYRVTFHGPGGHSWGAFGTANPAHALGRAVRLFDDAAAPFVASGPRTSYNVGVIGGGTSVNSVPFEAWMEVDMRSESPQRLLGVDSILHRSVEQALEEQNRVRKFGEPLTVEMKLVGDRPSGAIPADNPFVQRAIATAAQQGATPSLTVSSTDSNVPIARGIPAVTIGGGGVGGNAHALDEWWLNRNGPAGIKRALLLVLAEAKLEG
jgi:acetylornithine deacetylase/succinyl-diaminopimelate desuccinylase-like protein